jgi:acyl-CoA dehydrogenase
MQRSLRIADGPDEVHARTIARLEMARYSDRKQQERAEREADLLPIGSR